jgi:hypothetical protein
VASFKQNHFELRIEAVAVFNRNTWIVGPLAAAVFVLTWILCIQFKLMIDDPDQMTAALIKSNEKIIRNYVRAWGETPASLNDIRLYARQTGTQFVNYDVWGERLEYLRLGKVNYTLRSFGADGVQNRPGTRLDPGVFHWGLLLEKGLRYDEESGPMHARPSVVLFAGADDSRGLWHAKLFVDPISGSRRLLVRSRQKKNLYMLAPHDGVEEFLWVPGQQKIIFTASQSARYADGLYIWDLEKDEANNLFMLDGDMAELDPGNKQKNFYVALSAIRNENPPSVAVFVQSASSILLDPRAFFHPTNLHVFNLGDKIEHVYPDKAASQQRTLFNMEFLGFATVSPGGTGNTLQSAWMRLPMGGDWDKAVLTWQDFASSYGKSMLAPYAVWGISMIYSEASKSAGRGSKNGQIFASYSLELGRALSQMSVAPGYARAIGAWIGAKD